MINTSLLAALLLLSAEFFGQIAIPPGTILPVQLNGSLHSQRSRPGKQITARVMQDVPLPSGARIRSGSTVIGRIVESLEPQRGVGAKLTLQFDALNVSGRTQPIVSSLRAIGSMMDVEQAQVPTSGPDRGTSESSWITEQVGGDVVYHGGGPVTSSSGIVGRSTASGVLVQIAGAPHAKCAGEAGGPATPQALWVFSADACGLYGLPNLVILHAGSTRPVGEIILGAEKGNLDLRGGSGLLLTVR